MEIAQHGTRCLLKTEKHTGWVSYKDRTPRSRFVGYFPIATSPRTRPAKLSVKGRLFTHRAQGWMSGSGKGSARRAQCSPHGSALPERARSRRGEHVCDRSVRRARRKESAAPFPRRRQTGGNPRRGGDLSKARSRRRRDRTWGGAGGSLGRAPRGPAAAPLHPRAAERHHAAAAAPRAGGGQASWRRSTMRLRGCCSGRGGRAGGGPAAPPRPQRPPPGPACARGEGGRAGSGDKRALTWPPPAAAGACTSARPAPRSSRLRPGRGPCAWGKWRSVRRGASRRPPFPSRPRRGLTWGLVGPIVVGVELLLTDFGRRRRHGGGAERSAQGGRGL